MLSRNEKIIKLRKQGKIYRKIGNKFGITTERARQICNPVKKTPVFYCKKHNKKYRIECPFCKLDKYYNDILNENGNLAKEIKMLKVPDRRDDKVWKRRILIRKLHDEFRFPLRRIARLLKQDNSTILYSYKKIKGRS